MKTLIALFPLLVSLLFSSCDNMVDDQTIMTPEQYKVVNPQAFQREFQANNSKHKVLVAIMDTGVDYNHEYLKNNMHFKLSNAGMPLRSGWDFTGNDGWPAPYLARTNYFNPNLSAQDRQDSLMMLDAFKSITEEFPSLAKYFPMERNLEEEDSEGFDHGTHVAGLASYDSPEIGLLPYRIIPMNIPTNYDSFLGMVDPEIITRFSKVLVTSLEYAIADGAQVVNMSLGMTFDKKDEERSKEIFESFRNDLTQVIEKYPEVIFVVAAGNDGKWIDGTNLTVLPCLIPRSNVICVSALTEKMDPATFSNIVNHKDMTTIFAWGQDVLSTFPSKSCFSKKLDYLSVSKDIDKKNEFAKIALEDCKENQKLITLSGTSMASPIIARQVAKLKASCPSCSVKDIKTLLFSNAVGSTLDGMPIWKLPIQKPSWYSQYGNKSFSNQSWNFFSFKNQ